jgi:hypothetical protein
MKVFVIATLLAITTAAYAAPDLKTAEAGVKANVPIGSIIRKLKREGATDEQVMKIMTDLKQNPDAVAQSLKLWSTTIAPDQPK